MDTQFNGLKLYFEYFGGLKIIIYLPKVQKHIVLAFTRFTTVTGSRTIMPSAHKHTKRLSSPSYLIHSLFLVYPVEVSYKIRISKDIFFVYRNDDID